MKTIIFDVMGNDNGVKDAIESAIKFVKENLDYKVILVGVEKDIIKYTHGSERIQIVDAPAPKVEGNISSAARKQENSMTVAFNLLKEGKGDAVMSAGNSGLYLTNATLMLRRIPGVKRPAFMPIMPSLTESRKKWLLLDVGANVDSTGEMLAQWAKMGKAFSEAVLETKNPTVGLLNIGTESYKGKDFHHEANELIKADKTINYVGYVESRDLLTKGTDVVVVDGYAGNMVLKTIEGTALSMIKGIRTNLRSKLIYKIGGLISKGAFKSLMTDLDYKTVGAAWVIGVNGLVIKCHGSSDFEAFNGAFKQVSSAIEKNALEAFKGALNND